MHDVCSAIHPLALASPFLRALPLARARPRAGPPGRAAGAPARRRPRGVLRALGRATPAAASARDGAAPTRALFDPLVRHCDGALRRAARPAACAAPPAAAGPLRAARAPLGRPGLARRASTASARARAVRRAAPRTRCCRCERPVTRGVRPRARADRPRRRLADRARRLAARSPTRSPRTCASLGGEIETGPAGRVARRAAAGAAPRCSTSRPRSSLAIAGDAPARPLPARARALPLRARRVQARLGARRPDPVGGARGAAARGDGAPRRHARRDRRGRGATVDAAEHPERPFVLLAQQSLFDPTARAGRASTRPGPTATCRTARRVDMTAAIEAQVERFAPGFRDRDPRPLGDGPRRASSARNANYVGGDINGGVQDLRQLFARPVARLDARTRPRCRGVYLCSSSTPPGGGVHGMCGYWAARAALRASRRCGRAPAGRAARPATAAK